MKNYLSLSVLILAVAALTFTSCSKDEDPAYVGTWVMETTDDLGFGPMPMRITLVLSESAFEMTATMTADGVSMDMFGIKGGLSASGDKFTITPTSAGMADENTTTMQWVNKGDAGWSEMLELMEMSESEEATYVIIGNTMTITFEGDTPQIYTKQ